MPNLEPRWIADDGITDYDDGTLGCEAIIGELNVNDCRPIMKRTASRRQVSSLKAPTVFCALKVIAGA